jgi:hypothetical protein
VPENAKPSGIADMSLPDSLAALHVNNETGLTKAEAE